jgi:hypothetical protein
MRGLNSCSYADKKTLEIEKITTVTIGTKWWDSTITKMPSNKCLQCKDLLKAL